jgi:hypothetical protein
MLPPPTMIAHRLLAWLPASICILSGPAWADQKLATMGF